MVALLEGIDVSSYQGNIDWNAVKLAGKQFAFIKATEGLKYRDGWFDDNWHGAYNVGIPRIAYHFFYDNVDPVAQVQLLHSWVRANGHFAYGDAVMVDIEEASVTGAGTTVDKLRAFILDVWYEIDKPVIVYTNPDTWINILGNPVDTVVGQCPLFIADYGGKIPLIEQWPNGASFWQYSASGHVPGIVGEVDLDRFFGNRRQLRTILDTVPDSG